MAVRLATVCEASCSRIFCRVRFFDFFGKHAEPIIATCQELPALTADESDLAAKVRRIKDLEHQADDITHEGIDALRSLNGQTEWILRETLRQRKRVAMAQDAQGGGGHEKGC